MVNAMRYLHTMVRVANLDEALRFWCGILGLQEVRRRDSTEGRFTLVYLAAPDDLKIARQSNAPILELTWNWDPETFSGGRNFGHLAFEVADIYETCQKISAEGVPINRPPRDGYMAFVRSPEGISIELLQRGDRLLPAEPWLSMPNTGTW
jgi:lactoylglutathione lyase